MLLALCKFRLAEKFLGAGLGESFFHALGFSDGDFAAERGEEVIAAAFVVENDFGTAAGFGNEPVGFEAGKVAVKGADAEFDLVFSAAGDFFENGVAVLFAVG